MENEIKGKENKGKNEEKIKREEDVIFLLLENEKENNNTLQQRVKIKLDLVFFNGVIIQEFKYEHQICIQMNII